MGYIDNHIVSVVYIFAIFTHISIYEDEETVMTGCNETGDLMCVFLLLLHFLIIEKRNEHLQSFL